jgi:acyl-CoA thioester hydrolase
VLRHNADTEERTAVRGQNVYVVVSTDDWAKRPIPEVLREALTSLERQGHNARD